MLGTHPQMSRDNERTLLHSTGRKTRKALRGNRNESVWPEACELALISGLEIYRPRTNTDPSRLARFPRRNRDVAEYIFKCTNIRRTPKQVGSRIQQLRDTCENAYIQYLLTRREYPPPGQPEDLYMPKPRRVSAPAMSPSPIPSSPAPSESSHPRSASCDIKLPAQPLPIAIPTLTYAWTPMSGNESLDCGITPLVPQVVHDDVVPLRRVSIVLSLPLARVSNIIPFTVEFPLDPSSHYCVFTVFDDDVSVHRETTTFASAFEVAAGHDFHNYLVSLAPEYWPLLQESSEATRYTIVQEIIRAASPRSPEFMVLRVVYEFQHAAASTSTPILSGFGPSSIDSHRLPSGFPDTPIFEQELSLASDYDSPLILDTCTGHISPITPTPYEYAQYPTLSSPTSSDVTDAFSTMSLGLDFVYGSPYSYDESHYHPDSRRESEGFLPHHLS